MKVFWTNTARLSYFKILDYLKEKWSDKEVENFVLNTEKTIKQISGNPYMFKPSSKKKEIRRGFISNLTSIYYRVKPVKKEIDILLFFDNRKRPLRFE
ncbi:MAG: type II toxin-antitoxin system RelE/ParE family toxin [Bacteroidales bacterium]|nr:type II toxin-antitoxin system RelE/ParE family toxin [Bacteroidales bacterium]